MRGLYLLTIFRTCAPTDRAFDTQRVSGAVTIDHNIGFPFAFKAGVSDTIFMTALLFTHFILNYNPVALKGLYQGTFDSVSTGPANQLTKRLSDFLKIANREVPAGLM